MKQLVVIVIALGLAVGWLAPRTDERGGDAPEGRLGASDAAGARIAAARAAPLDGEALLDRAPDGHFYAQVAVDSVDLRMLVDTGASVVVLTGNDAEALGLEWRDEELFPVGRGASGEVIGKPVRLASVRLGELEADNVDAVIVPRGLDVSLLGQSFLGRVGKVEIEGSRMVLGNAS